MKFKIIAIIIIILSFSVPAHALYRVTDFIGGCADCLDSIDGARINAKTKPQYAIVGTTPEHAVHPSKDFVYLWDSDAGCTESISPAVTYIIPDLNAAGGCWVLLTQGQVDAINVDITDAGGLITGTEVETALQENRTAINLNTTAVATSAGLSASLSDETGSGAAVFGTSPTISGATIDSSPIGGTTPAAGAFTTLSATGEVTSTDKFTTGAADGDNQGCAFGDNDANSTINCFVASDTEWPLLVFDRARGSYPIGSFTAVQDGDPIWEIRGKAQNTSGTPAVGSIFFEANGISGDFMGTQRRWQTSPTTSNGGIDALFLDALQHFHPISDQSNHDHIAKYLDVIDGTGFISGWFAVSDAGTEIDWMTGEDVHTITYTSGKGWVAGDRVRKGSVWVLDPDGTTNYVTVTDAATLDVTNNDFNIAGWVKVITTGAAQTWIAKSENSAQQEWIVGLDSSKKIFLTLINQSSGNLNIAKYNASALSVGWHFIVWTIEGGGGTGCVGDYDATTHEEIKLYVNGVRIVAGDMTDTVNSLTCAEAMDAGTQDITIGAIGDESDYWAGNIAPVAFDIATVWTPAEIWKLYMKTRPDMGE